MPVLLSIFYLFSVAPNITVPPMSITTSVGLSITLDCVVFGLPPPSVFWTKDRVNLPFCTSQLPLDTVCVDNSNAVFINQVSMEDEGRYSCIAQNPGGVAVSEAFVSVEPALCEYG